MRAVKALIVDGIGEATEIRGSRARRCYRLQGAKPVE